MTTPNPTLAPQVTPEGAGAVAPPAGGTPPVATPNPPPAPGSILGGEATPPIKGGAAGEKTKEAPAGKPNEPVPTPFEVKLPDGAQLTETFLKDYTEEAKKLGLSSESASGLAAFIAKQNDAADEADVAEWKKRDGEWSESLKKDPDFGGASYDQSVALAKRGVLAFGGKELAAELQAWGLGNFPPLVKAFARAAKELKAEDASAVPVTPGASGKGSRQEELAVRYDHPDSQAARSGKR